MTGITVAVCAVAGGGAIVFSHLAISVGGDLLAWHFAGGVHYHSVNLADIVAADTVTDPPRYGWGYRNTPDGRLYNVAGSRAVSLVLRNGAHIPLGTDEPDRLLSAIKSGH